MTESGTKSETNLADTILNDFFAFVDSALQQQSNVVLIYCASSTNKSPTLAIAYLMHANQMTLADAVAKVKGLHGKKMCLSDGYMGQLREWDVRVNGVDSMENANNTNGNANNAQTKSAKIAAILAKMKATEQQLQREEEEGGQ